MTRDMRVVRARGEEEGSGASRNQQGRGPARARRRMQTVLQVREDDLLLMECSVMPAYSGVVGRLLRGRRVLMRVAACPAPAEGTVRAATLALLRHFAVGGEGLWDFIELRPESHVPLVCLAACEFAILMDFGCDLGPDTTGETVACVLSTGHRSRLAQFVEHVAWPRRLGTRLLGGYHAVRRQLHRSAFRRGETMAEIHMVLALPVPAARELRPPDPVRFDSVDATAALLHPRRYASYGVDVEQRIARGDLCFAGTAGRQVVYSMWLSLDPSFIAVRAPRLHRYRRSGYVYDSHTHPLWRGQGIYGAALHWVARTFGDSVDHLTLSVQPNNLSSIRAAVKAGFVRVADGPRDSLEGRGAAAPSADAAT